LPPSLKQRSPLLFRTGAVCWKNLKKTCNSEEQKGPH